MSKSLPEIVYVYSNEVPNEEFRIRQLKLHGFKVHLYDSSSPLEVLDNAIVMGATEEVVDVASHLGMDYILLSDKNKKLVDGSVVKYHSLEILPGRSAVFVDGEDLKFGSINFDAVLRKLGYGKEDI